MEQLKSWFRRTFSDPQIVILVAVLLVGFFMIAFFGNMLAPAMTAVVIAYLLDGLVSKLQRGRIPRLPSVLIVFTIFMAFVVGIIFVFLPKLSVQIAQLVQQIPSMIARGSKGLMSLPERYPEYVSPQQLQDLMGSIQSELTSWGQTILTHSVASVMSLIELLVYAVLVPLLIFFFLKDKDRILNWVKSFLPSDYSLTARIWSDVDQQIGNYIRGKFWEILVVWAVTYIVFSFLDLQYTMLLALFVGLSVLVPYIGATVMTLPILLIGLFQFGWGLELAWVMIAYGIIQLLDGNLLAPLLMSGVTNLHPVAVIVAVLVFGGLWGFWGIFFAIPLATLVQAIIKAWPRRQDTL